MAPHALLAPSNSPLPDTLRVPPCSSLSKTLSKLSRPSLLRLAVQWLQPQNQRTCFPFLAEDSDEGADEDSAYPLAETLDQLIGTYHGFQNRRGSKGEILDRILEGDWRHGMSLRQLAMADMQYLMDHPASMKWTALKLTQVTAEAREPSKKRQKTDHDPIPCFHAATFLRNLQSQISPVVKAHYHVHHPTESIHLPMTILRIYTTDSPYKNPKTASGYLTDSTRIVYVAFPDSCPYVYISLSSAGASMSVSWSDTQILKRVVVDAIPKALSSQYNRFKLETTSLSAKSLKALLNHRGNGRTNNSQGAFTVFASGSIEESPLDPTSSEVRKEKQHQNSVLGKESGNPYPTPGDAQPSTSQPIVSQTSLKRLRALPNGSTPSEESALKRRKAIAVTRFGSSAADPEDGTGLDRFEIRLEEPLPFHPSIDSGYSSRQPSGSSTRTTSCKRKSLFDSYEPQAPALEVGDERLGIHVTFTGTHIFAGIRGLVEQGVIDGEKMPKWMTGEDGVSVGVVRDGKLLGAH